MITVSYSQLECYNPYLRMYTQALSRYGIEPGPVLRCQDEFLRENVGQVHALHIQWCPYRLWRPFGPQKWWKDARTLAGFWTYLRLARRLGYKIIWTIHDVERHDGDKWADRIGYRLLARNTDLCISHDRWAAEQFVSRYGGRAERVVLMPIGNYDPALPKPSRSRSTVLANLGLDPAKPTFLCQGTIREYKGYDLAIEAFRRLGVGYQLIVAGVVVEQGFEARLQAMGAGAANIRLRLTQIEDQEVVDLGLACDGYILPYRRLTGSAVLLTAWTLGRAVICSDLPYFAEMLRLDPVTGVMFPAGDVDGLCTAVIEFLKSGPQSRGLAARRLADQFDWDRVTEPVAAWYHRAFPELISTAVEQRAGDQRVSIG